MKRLLLVSALLLSSAAWADVPPPGGCDCSSSSGVPLALLGVMAVWAARQR
ncbi:MYXO-CTERM sorting domain-containing protein [Hyalangium gracile]|uniref:MYXO-CTERM sorting domain-containing protein n=1 Tax=Hyalangium gracile TaxID=394092 RepID=UPI001CCB9BAD|nr:MYXO-CTERM sorting domain-containing protein [Hyalangium gracile]